ncbi:MAG: acetyl-CoA carboxylase biotin carboxyl carrier protein [Gammaproteobacteria bacterium]
MDIRKVKKLIELLEESGMAEIEIHEGEESVRISRGQAPLIQSPTPLPAVVQPISQAVEERAIEEEKVPIDGKQITSPMVGTFYAAASPESSSFVKLGDQISVGDTLCIIEAMKIMNPIEAEIGGIVSAILVDNASPVEFGQPLFVIS